MAAVRRLPLLFASLAIGLVLLSATLVAASGWPAPGVDDSHDEVLLARAVLLTPAGVALTLLLLAFVIAVASSGDDRDDRGGTIADATRPAPSGTGLCRMLRGTKT